MLHLLYIFLFTIIALLTISNLIRNLINLSSHSQRLYSSPTPSFSVNGNGYTSGNIPHPELLDDNGKVINEPLLVMRSVSVEDAREQLDAIYNSSPGKNPETEA